MRNNTKLVFIGVAVALARDATESRVQFRFRFQFRVVFFGLLMIIVIFFVDYRCGMSCLSWVRLSSVWLSWVGLSWAQLNWVGLGFGLGLVEKYLVGLCFVESVCSAFLFGCRCSGSDKYEKKTLWSFWSINKWNKWRRSVCPPPSPLIDMQRLGCRKLEA